MTFLGFEFAAPAIGLGLIRGTTYALLAIGLVLVYRNSKLVNFAQGDIGVGAAIAFWVTTVAGLPYWLAFPAAVALGGLIAGLLERSVIERLRYAPRLIAALATIGGGQFVFYVATTLIRATRRQPFPQPPGVPEVHLGSLIIQPAQLLALLLGPVVILGLVLFMTKTSWGLALRGAAAGHELAQLSGFPSGKLSALTWSLSGGIAAFTAILLFGLESDSPPPTGLDLLLPALTATVIARMSGFVTAGLAGMAIGVTHHLFLWNGLGSGEVAVVMFGLIFAILLITWRTDVDIDRRSRWLPIVVGKTVRIGPLSLPVVPLLAAAGGAIALLVLRPTDVVTATTLFGFVLLALSTAVVAGLSGQLVLGQAAYAGFGAMASVAITVRTGNFVLGFAGAAVTGGLTAVLTSLPALRRRDLSLAVLSLAFAIATVTWAFPQSWMFGTGLEPGRPVIGTFAFDTARSYGALTLGVLCIGLVAIDRLWRSAFARRAVAQRDNPQAAASFGISAPFVRAEALLVSGAVAGVAGALLAHASVITDGSSFSVTEGMRALGSAVLGGLASVSGSVWGTLWMVGIPSFAGGILAFIAASWVGWLLVMVAVPAGITGAFARGRHASESPPDPESLPAPSATLGREIPPLLSQSAQRGGVVEARSVALSFGSVTAVRGIDLQFGPDEILAIVGSNGAGKSTLLDVLSGARHPDQGQIFFDGRDVTALGPEGRARLGIARSLEGAILFPTLTVLETTMMALENPGPAGIRRRGLLRADAMEVITWIGLESIATVRMGELSTGLRRMAQLACLCARRPRVLLLDEPTSGIAEAELDGVVGILEVIRSEMGTSILMVEHELRVVHRLASRVIALDSGRVVAEGTPAQVLGRVGTQG